MNVETAEGRGRKDEQIAKEGRIDFQRLEGGKMEKQRKKRD